MVLQTEVLVVSEVRQVFEAEKVKVEYLEANVRITGTQEELRSKLWHLKANKSAHAAPEANIVVTNRCVGCGIVDYSTWDGGLAIDESTWDGADFFRLYEDVAGFVVTEKFRDIVIREGFSGVAFIPAKEYNDPYPESRPQLPR